MITWKDKTVFFLGAGMSAGVDAPLQSQIIPNILSYNGPDYNNPVQTFRENFIDFMNDAFKIDILNNPNFSLEDFYTIIDKCIVGNHSFRGYSVKYLRKIRNELSILIGIAIDHAIINSSNSSDYLDMFVKKVIARRRKKKRPDNVSIITSNWDITIDKRLFSQLNTLRKTERENARGVIDFGTHAVSYLRKQEDQLIPPLAALSRGIFTIKYYKIHGSLNWLKCPNCNRLFINPTRKEGITDYKSSLQCRFCVDEWNTYENHVGILEPQMIYPTFLKDFSNIHFTRIWDNLGIELSEARNLVFIGYSFPQADFELRQLLARKVPNNCHITVVNHRKNIEQEDRYFNFFGQRAITFFNNGVEAFINETEF